MDIKPCPFCGGTNIGVGPGDSFRWMLAYCHECGAQSGEVRVQTLGAGDPAEWQAAGYKSAIEEWNTRATPLEGRKPVCVSCDGTGEIEMDNNGPIVSCPICKPREDRKP